MKLKAIALFIMLAWVTSVMWCQTLSIEETCMTSVPAFPMVLGPLAISANIFWTAFYTIALAISFTLIWGSKPITTKAVVKGVKKEIEKMKEPAKEPLLDRPEVELKTSQEELDKIKEAEK